MLVLVSFGLVLLATILLVVGFLGDGGLTLIYLSIAASCAAGLVLWQAFRRARPSLATTAGPAPLAEPLDDDTTTMPATVPPTSSTPTVADGPAPGPAAPAVAESDDEWMADADWETDGVDFPIADYDELTVAEIMPLLPQLYSDELDEVVERERSGRNRSEIIERLEELKRTGTEADATDDGATEAAVVDGAVDAPSEPEPAPAAPTPEVAPPSPAPTATPPAVETPAPAPAAEPVPAPAIDEPAPVGRANLFGDDEDDGFLFPIADYDDLSVSQIVPLLGQLEADELDEVREREAQGAGRRPLLDEIDRLLTGTAAAAPAAPAPVETSAAKEPATRTSASTTAPAKKSAAKKPSARKAPAKKSAAKKTAAKKTAAKKTVAKKAPAKKRSAAKKAAARFPIEGYDEMTVADIRPRLTGLSAAELELVRERERSGAGRKTILKEIDNKLG